MAAGCTVTIQTWAEAQVSELGKSRVHLSVFVVVVCIPAIASALAFSAGGGLAGFIIGVIVLANCAAVFDWVRLPGRRLHPIPH